MGTAAAVIGLVSALVGAGTAYHQSQQAAEARDDAADQMEKQATRDSEILEKESERLTAKQRALFAASGVRVDEGSPLAVIAASQAEAQAERDAVMQGYSYRIGAMEDDASAIRTTGYLTTAGTLLGGAATYATSPYARNPFKSTSSFATGPPVPAGSGYTPFR